MSAFAARLRVRTTREAPPPTSMLQMPLRWLGQLWRNDAALTFTGVFFAAALLPALAGIWLDDRVITGAPAWLKPSKFAASVSIYALTLAWIFGYIPDWRRTRRVVGRTTTIVLFTELAIIAVQAARGVTSHFNVGTPFDGALFGIMGVAIFTQTFASIAVAYALWRQPFNDAALGWALRFGMTLTIVGALTGGLMTRPTADQLARARATGVMTTAGAHTVGGEDGGLGMPGTGWSTRHGDLRVPHFIGLHAVQALPLVALVGRRRSSRTRVPLVITAAFAYAGLFTLALARALLGLPLL